ncbi:signal peptidase I [Elusimicrobium simillimum]|uniref:signal peptidase I n=1 Tax=Elusimicrobium simillimum TaxID=3143438 RepID=UPI003C6F859B
MESRLFIIGVIMLVWAVAAKVLKKKNLLENKYIFTVLHVAFAAIAAALALWLFDFVSNGGDAAALAETSLTKKLFSLAVILGLSIWAFISAWRADKKKKVKLFDKDYEWADTIYFSALLAAFVMFFFIQAFKIPSASMRNTLIEGDHLFVNKFTYGFRIPLTDIRFLEFNKVNRGDVIVFAFPADSREQINCGGPQYGRDYVKRVIGMPGDTVEVRGAQVYINGEAVPHQDYELYENIERYPLIPLPDSKESYQQKWEDRELEHYYSIYLRDQFGPVTVPEDSYFAIGDNRDNSCDSRFWGPVPRENIKGKAWFIHWPASRIKLIK